MAATTVLVVDDDRAFRRLTCEGLSRAGFAVTAAGDADEALAAVGRDPPALVVLDVKLPRVSGYELLQELRDQLGPELPVIFVSGERVDRYDRIAGLLLGGDDYLLKPFDPDELVARARRLMQTAARQVGQRSLESLAALLTPREGEILTLLSRGHNTAEIAENLVISTRTLTTHIQHILAKLGANNRAQAVAIAHETGLIDDLSAQLPPST